MRRLHFDETFSDAALAAIVRARFARYDVSITDDAPALVEITVAGRVHRFTGATKRIALLSAMEFTP